jgi:hypothetical protein
MWNKYLPTWRALLNTPKKPPDPGKERRTLEEVKQMSESPDLIPTDADWGIDGADYVSIQKSVRVKKGKFLRFSEDQINRMHERGELK